jgi:hypothetical protein
MKVLLLTKIDAGGSAWFLREALTQAGHEARQVRWRESDYIGYPADLIQPGEAKLRALWNWADVVHVHDTAPFIPCEWWREGRPTVITYHGSMYRDNPRKYRLEAIDRRWLQTVATPDLTNLCPRWMPDSRPAYAQAEPYAGGIFRVAHAPTNRYKKGTEAILIALDGMKGVELDVIEDISHDECIARKLEAHLVVDQTTLGYGCNAIEAWSMGLPVISGGDKGILRRVQACVGAMPFLVARNAREIAEQISAVMCDDRAYSHAVRIGRDCFEKHHSYQAVAAIAVKWYVEAME